MKIQKYEIELDHFEQYKLFGEDVTLEELEEVDWDYLPETYALVLKSLFMRTNEVSIMFHPDVVKSIMEDKENSSYYNKTPHEIEVILRRESTKSDTESAEQKKILQPVDMSDQIIKNRKYKATQMLVRDGFDRPFVMEYLDTYMQEHGTGIMNLTPKRISQIITESIEKEQRKKKFRPKNLRQPENT